MAELYCFSDGVQQIGFSPKLLSETYTGVTYTATAISRSSLELTGNLARNQVTFSFPNSNSFAKNRVFEIPGIGWEVTILEDYQVVWFGRLVGATLKGAIIDLVMESSERTIDRNATGARFSLHCWKNLYSITCGVNKAAFLTSLSGTAAGDYVTVAGGLTENFFAGGILEMNGESRRILSNSATVLQLANRLTLDGVGTISLYPGCNLTSTNCTAFGNFINFGGFEHIPFVNPTDRSGIL